MRGSAPGNVQPVPVLGSDDEAVADASGAEEEEVTAAIASASKRIKMEMSARSSSVGSTRATSPSVPPGSSAKRERLYCLLCLKRGEDFS